MPLAGGFLSCALPLGRFGGRTFALPEKLVVRGEGSQHVGASSCMSRCQAERQSARILDYGMSVVFTDIESSKGLVMGVWAT